MILSEKSFKWHMYFQKNQKNRTNYNYYSVHHYFLILLIIFHFTNLLSFASRFVNCHGKFNFPTPCWFLRKQQNHRTFSVYSYKNFNINNYDRIDFKIDIIFSSFTSRRFARNFELFRSNECQNFSALN